MPTNAQMAERRRAQIAPRLDQSDVLLGSFVMQRSSAATLAAVGGFMGMLGGVAGAALGALVGWGAGGSDSVLIVAVLEDGVVLFGRDWRGRPKRVVRRLPGRHALGPVEGSMEGRVTLDGTSYDIPVGCVDDARRLLGTAPRS
jgi:hypothetical protein